MQPTNFVDSGLRSCEFGTSKLVNFKVRRLRSHRFRIQSHWFRIKPLLPGKESKHETQLPGKEGQPKTLLPGKEGQPETLLPGKEGQPETLGESEIANFKRSADLWLQRWRFLRHRRGTSTVRNLFCSWTRVRQKSLWRTRPAHFLKSPPMETCSDLAAVHHWFNQTLFIEHLSYMTCSARCFPKSNIRQHLRLEIPTQRDLCGKFY